MAYKIILTEKADKQLRELDPPIQRRIADYIQDVTTIENPRQRGKKMQVNFNGGWRYKVGDYRILCDIYDDTITVFIIRIKHRKDVYR